MKNSESLAALLARAQGHPFWRSNQAMLLWATRVQRYREEDTLDHALAATSACALISAALTYGPAPSDRQAVEDLLESRLKIDLELYDSCAGDQEPQAIDVVAIVATPESRKFRNRWLLAILGLASLAAVCFVIGVLIDGGVTP